MELIVENVDEALPILLTIMKQSGQYEPSRNGQVLALPDPVTVRYRYPRERFVMHPLRRTNVAFLIMEGLWMLAGSDEVEWLARFNERMREYSDNGKTFHGAYGYRLRQHFNRDQLLDCAELLREDQFTRRAVAQIWDTTVDLSSNSKDIPCNDLIMFRVNNQTKRLDMTVCNRSNDLVWGMCGANAAHFSMIQEYVAAKAGYPFGYYNQVSNNLHLYVDTPQLERYQQIPSTNGNWYKDNMSWINRIPLIQIGYSSRFDSELATFMEDTSTDKDSRIERYYHEPFFQTVAKPLFNFWMTRKYALGPRSLWMHDIERIADTAVRTLAEQWVQTSEY